MDIWRNFTKSAITFINKGNVLELELKWGRNLEWEVWWMDRFEIWCPCCLEFPSWYHRQVFDWKNLIYQHRPLSLMALSLWDNLNLIDCNCIVVRYSIQVSPWGRIVNTITSYSLIIVSWWWYGVDWWKGVIGMIITIIAKYYNGEYDWIVLIMVLGFNFGTKGVECTTAVMVLIGYQLQMQRGLRHHHRGKLRKQSRWGTRPTWKPSSKEHP